MVQERPAMETFTQRAQAVLDRHPGFRRSAAMQDAAWDELVHGILREHDLPFEEHWRLFREIYGQRRPQDGPPHAWIPSKQAVEASNIAALMAETGHLTYRELHAWSVRDRRAFWERTIQRLGVVFETGPESVLAPHADVKRPGWLRGARLNAVDSCFTAPADRVAVVSGAEDDDEVTKTTYGELEALVNRVANGFIDAGFEPGDAVALYMPMTLQCVAAYLGIVRAGGVVVSVADSFAPKEVATRLRIGGAKGLVTVEAFARSGARVDLYEKVTRAEAPRAIVIPEREGGSPGLRVGDVLWADFLSDSTEFASVAGAPGNTTNVLFSSGTTGEPKAIPWTHLTPIKAAADGHYHQDVRPGDVVAWPTNIGWMMGPWLIYAALVNGATMALFEGVPTSKDFVRFVEASGVTVLGLVPSVVRKWRETGATEGADLGRVRILSSTGEASNAQDYLWLMSRTEYRAPVIEYCGGTEIGGGHITGSVVQPASPGTFSTPALGIEFVALDADGQPVPEGAMGELFVVPPSIGLSETLLNKDHDEVYYAGCPTGPEGQVLRRHGDEVERLYHGFWRAHGRADDTMNLGGIKVSSIELETVMNAHADVFETAAVSVRPRGGGADVLVVYVVPGAEGLDPAAWRAELQALVKQELNPLFRVHEVVLIEALPRTASNKVMRRQLRAEYEKRTAA